MKPCKAHRVRMLLIWSDAIADVTPGRHCGCCCCCSSRISFRQWSGDDQSSWPTLTTNCLNDVMCSWACFCSYIQQNSINRGPKLHFCLLMSYVFQHFVIISLQSNVLPCCRLHDQQNKLNRYSFFHMFMTSLPICLFLFLFNFSLNYSYSDNYFYLCRR